MATVMVPYPARDGFQGFSQQYTMYQARPHQPQADIAQSMSVQPYANYAQVPAPQTQTYSNPQSRPTQASHSPVVDDGLRPSLPSISNLLGIADGDRPSQDTAPQQAQMQAQQSHQYAVQGSQCTPTEQRHPQPQAYTSQDYSSNSQRTAIPPTPPLRNDSVLDGTQSPSTISTGSSLSVAQPYFMASALNNVEATDQRTVAANAFMKRHSVPSQPNISPFGTYNTSPYAHSPGGASNSSYYSPPDPNFPSSGLYHQRPLPSNFPPQAPQPIQQHQNSPPKVWQHHHYIHPSSQAQFSQPQDRYICPTCNKAFSRPSSLKIHSHSHTGEKPFKCPHGGCGKSFSVRSNMKRHERGCHTAGGMMGPTHLL